MLIGLRLYSVKPTKSLPGIMLLKDMKILLHSEEAMHGPSWKCPACELFGFGTGALTLDDTDLFKGRTIHPAKSI